MENNERNTALETLLIEGLLAENLQLNSNLSRSELINWYKRLVQWIIPEQAETQYSEFSEVSNQFNELRGSLTGILESNLTEEAFEKSFAFFQDLVYVKEQIEEDARAFYRGDPAARSIGEVKRCYPGYFALVSYRIAHLLHDLDIEYIPRIITEYAHEITGVDIHPGATIGKSFCVDHGTGVVIGETAVIGDNVKIYQGVTLGALSLHKTETPAKRHPTIEDNVVIYAGATVLGGGTTIGRGSVIGGNVWVIRSVPEYSTIYYRAHLTTINKEIDTIEIRSAV